MRVTIVIQADIEDLAPAHHRSTNEIGGIVRGFIKDRLDDWTMNALCWGNDLSMQTVAMDVYQPEEATSVLRLLSEKPRKVKTKVVGVKQPVTDEPRYSETYPDPTVEKRSSRKKPTKSGKTGVDKSRLPI